MPIQLEDLMRAAILERKLRGRIIAELRRRGAGVSQAVSVGDVAKAVHGRLKPGESIEFTKVKQMVRDICEDRWGCRATLRKARRH